MLEEFTIEYVLRIGTDAADDPFDFVTETFSGDGEPNYDGHVACAKRFATAAEAERYKRKHLPDSGDYVDVVKLRITFTEVPASPEGVLVETIEPGQLFTKMQGAVVYRRVDPAQGRHCGLPDSTAFGVSDYGGMTAVQFGTLVLPVK